MPEPAEETTLTKPCELIQPPSAGLAGAAFSDTLFNVQGAPDLSSQADHELPVLDDKSFTVRHGRGSHHFSARNKQLFALLERICRRPGYRVLFNDLRSIGDVWDGAFVEDNTIRGAVARLRSLLRQHHMKALAERITTGTYRGNRYVMLRVNDKDDV